MPHRESRLKTAFWAPIVISPCRSIHVFSHVFRGRRDIFIDMILYLPILSFGGVYGINNRDMKLSLIKILLYVYRCSLRFGNKGSVLLRKPIRSEKAPSIKHFSQCRDNMREDQ